MVIWPLPAKTKYERNGKNGREEKGKATTYDWGEWAREKREKRARDREASVGCRLRVLRLKMLRSPPAPEHAPASF